MKKILLIDDDQDIAELIVTLLSDQYEVHSKNDNTDIAGKLQAVEPDLVMLDNTVGQSKAIDIVPQLQNADGYNIVPIVLFSAHADIEGIAAKIQADAFLTKPFDLNELYSCIDQLLNQPSQLS